MLASERQMEIYRLLRRDGAVKVAELSASMGVSEMTVRRDLEELESRNLARRVHGGAVATLEQLGQITFAVQSTREVEKKLAIAREAITLVEPGMHVAVDGSSTGLEFARLLKDVPEITIVTNSLGILWEFHNLPGLDLVMLGGSVAIDGNSLDGPLAVENASRLSVDLFFFSCAGFDAEGITNASPVAGDVRRTLIANAKRSVLLADSAKYDNKGFIRLFGWEDVDVLISDGGLAPEACESIRAATPRLEIRLAT